jgi:Xaa-Pro aminopeptidase
VGSIGIKKDEERRREKGESEMKADALTTKKLKRIRDEMRRRDVAALLLCENGRTRYVTGYQRYFTATYLAPVHAVLVTHDADPVLFLPRHVMPAQVEFFSGQVLVFPFSDEARCDLLQKTLRELKVEGPIAVELDFLPYDFVTLLKHKLGKTPVVDGAPLINAVTAVKFDEELKILRETARIADAGIAAAIESIREGATEIEVGARSSGRMLDEGAEFINHMTVRSGPHSTGCFPLLTSRKFQKGECVQLDIGCCLRGYISDTNRTVVIGAPTPEQRRLLRVGQDMLEAGTAAVRAGIKVSEIWDAVYGVADRAGMSQFITIPFAGHGVGIGLHELPYIVPNSKTILEKNMVMALEPGVYADGIGGSRPEDMLVVTDKGCEVLTHHPRDYDMLA